MAIRNKVAAALYFFTFFVYIYSDYYDIVYVHAGEEKDYLGKLKYFTIWNMCLQTLYFGLCALNAVAGSNVPASVHPSQRSTLQRWRDTLHTALAFPVGMFVVTTFWGLYAVDRELVYPKALDHIIPPWLNHVMHTTVLPLLLLEKYLVYHHHPRRRRGIFILSAFALIYLVWVLWIAYASNIWVYPVLRVMQNYERALFIAFLLVFFICVYLLGEALTRFFWRKEKAELLVITTKRQF